MPLKMSESQYRKHVQKKKPDVFITLRREQFEELEARLRELAVDRRYFPNCHLCGNRNVVKGATEVAHAQNCPITMLSKLEKV